MGYLKDRHGMEMQKIKPDNGQCDVCGCVHEPELPHNQQSLYYQYHFYDMHGRWPNWNDAMEHCSQEMKEFWKTELMKRGIPEEQFEDMGGNDNGKEA